MGLHIGYKCKCQQNLVRTETIDKYDLGPWVTVAA